MKMTNHRSGIEGSLLGSDGRALSGDGLESGLDGLDGTPGVAGHALQEKQSSLLVQNRIRRSEINWEIFVNGKLTPSIKC
jgi:hypothetical protein